MPTDLAGAVRGVPERFVPSEMLGQIIEAEHMARYTWATRFCQDARVLDAGCGTGYGAALIKQAGASEVIAVDLSEAVIETARQGVPDGVRCEVGDLRSLTYEDNSFDLVICFEVIEHVEDQDGVLDELSRVLDPGGILLISSPNRERYVPGNPHHHHEYVPSELRDALRHRFAEVSLIQQHLMTASIISAPGDAQPNGMGVLPLVEPRSDDEVYTLAIAGSRLRDPGPSLVALTSFAELREWLRHYEDQDKILHNQRNLLDEMETLRQERLRALELLTTKEQELAVLPGLREEVSELHELRDRLASLENVEAELAHASTTIEGMSESLSWRMTSPLRWVMRIGRGLRGSS